MLSLNREPNNIEDNTAVAVLKSLTVVGHVPKELSPLFPQFLRLCKKGIAKVTGNKVNHGAGLGLEIPCTYRPYGPKASCDRLKKILEESTSCWLMTLIRHNSI